MIFCTRCNQQGYCSRISSKVFGDELLSNTFWLVDFKAFLVRYGFRQKLMPGDWQDHIADLYCKYRGWISGPSGEEVFLDTQVYEIPHIREWFRDFIRPVPEGASPHVRREARERVRVLATIMRAYYPKEAMMWGVRAANDN